MNGRVLTCCMACGCKEESEMVLSYLIRKHAGSDKDFATTYTHKNHDEFCVEHAYEFEMYFTNYLGLKVTVKRINRPVKVQFT